MRFRALCAILGGMEIFATGSFFVLGTIIGSFLNVVILRHNSGATLAGRSRCFACDKAIAWHDLIPVASFLALRGRCRGCKSRFSIQYPLVELLTGLLFAGVFWKFLSVGLAPLFNINYFLLVADLFVFCLLVVIAVYDLRHKIIPDPFVFLFAALALGKLFFSVPLESLFASRLADILAGPLLALPLFLLWLVSGGRWIGLGDAKLALGIGWFLGLALGLSALVWGFWIGAVVGLSLVGFSKLFGKASVRRVFLKLGLKKLTMGSELPLAPFLILGLCIVYFWGSDVTGFSVLFQ